MHFGTTRRAWTPGLETRPIWGGIVETVAVRQQITAPTIYVFGGASPSFRRDRAAPQQTLPDTASW
jgi:hypothetical protein